MRMFLFFSRIIISNTLFTAPHIFAYGSSAYDGQALIEAGCKIDTCRKMCDKPRWHGTGKLLQKGACIENTYSKTAVPEKGITKAYCTIVTQRIRNIDSRNEELTIDISLKRRWVDPGIMANFSDEDLDGGGIPLEQEQLKMIWKPDVYYYNLSEYKTLIDSIQVKSFFLMPFDKTVLANVKGEDRQNDSNQTVVELTEEAKVKVYCNFHLHTYPMDTQNCRFRFGSRSAGTKFVLLEDSKMQHNRVKYKTEDFNIKVDFINNADLNGISLVGFDIEMDRILKPYIMEYYLPCVASILVSHIGFVIPLKSISGRAALLVTQFLSLINLFIAGMVRLIKFYHSNFLTAFYEIRSHQLHK